MGGRAEPQTHEPGRPAAEAGGAHGAAWLFFFSSFCFFFFFFSSFCFTSFRSFASVRHLQLVGVLAGLFAGALAGRFATGMAVAGGGLLRAGRLRSLEACGRDGDYLSTVRVNG
jgi:hypothetical protein